MTSNRIKALLDMTIHPFFKVKTSFPSLSRRIIAEWKSISVKFLILFKGQ